MKIDLSRAMFSDTTLHSLDNYTEEELTQLVSLLLEKHFMKDSPDVADDDDSVFISPLELRLYSDTARDRFYDEGLSFFTVWLGKAYEEYANPKVTSNNNANDNIDMLGAMQMILHAVKESKDTTTEEVKDMKSSLENKINMLSRDMLSSGEPVRGNVATTNNFEMLPESTPYIDSSMGVTLISDMGSEQKEESKVDSDGNVIMNEPKKKKRLFGR